MELETIIVRLYDRTGDERGFIELPATWPLGPSDLLLDSECRLVRVITFMLCPLGSPVSALVKVTPAPTLEHLSGGRGDRADS